MSSEETIRDLRAQIERLNNIIAAQEQSIEHAWKWRNKMLDALRDAHRALKRTALKKATLDAEDAIDNGVATDPMTAANAKSQQGKR